MVVDVDAGDCDHGVRAPRIWVRVEVSCHALLHTTNPLCELGKALGAVYLQDLQREGNAQYTLEILKQDMHLLRLLLHSLKVLLFSPCIYLATDFSITKQHILYAHYLVKGLGFICLLELPDLKKNALLCSLQGTLNIVIYLWVVMEDRLR